MRTTLVLHPDSICTVTGIDVDVLRQRNGKLTLHYVVTGGIADLHLPPAAAPERTDGLWRRTCFEAFVRTSPGDAYYEFNFAPSTQWAAYRFDGYRADMSPADGIGAPHIETTSGDGRYELEVTLSMPDLPRDSAWQLGLSAVIKEAGGGLSYWALAHPPGKADFHHSDCFALELAPA